MCSYSANLQDYFSHSLVTARTFWCGAGAMVFVNSAFNHSPLCRGPQNTPAPHNIARSAHESSAPEKLSFIAKPRMKATSIAPPEICSLNPNKWLSL